MEGSKEGKKAHSHINNFCACENHTCGGDFNKEKPVILNS